MEKTIDRIVLVLLTGVGAILFPFWIRKPPLKDWTIVFLLAGFLSGMLDLFVTAHKLVDYPIQIFGKKLNISLLFDYFLFPTLGVFYNQVTYRSKIGGILGKAFFFSIPITIAEYWFAGHTKLIKWKKWNSFYTLTTVTLVFWLERAFISVVRKFSHYFQQDKTSLGQNQH